MPCPLKICFTNKVNTICGGDQLLVTGSQSPITRVLGVRIPCPRVASPKAQGPRFSGLKVPGSRVSGLRVLGSRSQVSRSRISDPDFSLCHYLSCNSYCAEYQIYYRKDNMLVGSMFSQPYRSLIEYQNGSLDHSNPNSVIGSTVNQHETPLRVDISTRRFSLWFVFDDIFAFLFYWLFYLRFKSL